MFKKITAIFFSLLLSTSLVFAYTSPGAAGGYMNDFAHVLNSDQQKKIELELKDFETQTTNELTVVTISSLGGDTIENYAVKLFEEWQIGKKDKDNGVLLLIAVQDKKIRIEVGYGLESLLTDAKANQIIQKNIRPAFQAAAFYQGIDNAVEAIIATIKGDVGHSLALVPDQSSVEGDTSIGGYFTLVLSLYCFFTMFLTVLKRPKAKIILNIIAGTLLGILLGAFYWIPIAIIGLFVFSTLFDLYLRFSSAGITRGSRWSESGTSSSSSNDTSSSGSFGGFGGGSSGGGGASGSW